MDVIDLLKSQIAKNESERIANDANETTRPKILHTQYLGDRTVQQLGQEPIENAVVLNNAANAIGDALMPLAKGSPLQRFDSVNQDDGVGTKRRSLLDDEANRNRRSTITIRTGEQKPANDPLIGTPRGDDPLPPIYPPPFGCVPVGGGGVNCIWTTNATPPTEYQSHGSAVINENGLELFLHCKIAVVPPTDLGCTFLQKWKCSGGVCSLDANGPYNSQAECEAARIPAGFTGGQCATNYEVYWRATCIRTGNFDPTQLGDVRVLVGYSNVTGFDYFLGPLTSIGTPYEGFNKYFFFNISTGNGDIKGFTTFVGIGDTGPTGARWSVPVIDHITGSPNNCGNPPFKCP